MPEPDHRLVPVPSAQLALAGNHLALLNKILPPAVHGPVPGRPWEIAHLGLKLVWIEPGTFLMGGQESVMRPVTQVTLTEPYWLGQTTVTQQQYEEVMGNNPSHFKETGKDAPVESVSWNDAMEFCQKLTAREGAARRLPAGYQFTLPTEAQWEYACRAGTTGDFAGTGKLDDMGWYKENSGGTMHPVGMKQPNAWGLYDMQGNVMEWCRDWFGIYSGGSVINPTGPTSDPEFGHRVNRGGCWGLGAAMCRAAFRSGLSPDWRIRFLGFRLALSSVG